VALSKILLLEHDSSTRKSISDQLRAHGYEVTETDDGDRAVELLTDRFDLVITDFVHSGVDGLKLVEYIRSKWPQTPVIFTSAYLSVSAAAALLEGRAEFLSKPIDLVALPGTVKRLITSEQS
jgi:CheY-like chemotaxis protein